MLFWKEPDLIVTVNIVKVGNNRTGKYLAPRSYGSYSCHWFFATHLALYMHYRFWSGKELCVVLLFYPYLTYLETVVLTQGDVAAKCQSWGIYWHEKSKTLTFWPFT